MRLYVVVLVLISFLSGYAQDTSTKKERNFIREGNKMYNEKRYGDAEKLYQKALQENENSSLAKFNLATTYLRQTTTTDTTQNGLLSQANKLLEEVSQSANAKLASRAFYDLGNISYNQKNYQKSIDYYKNSLRKNPDDDEARQNLRLAQKQLQNQQNNQNQDNKDNKDNKQNQKQNQDQNKEKNKDGQDQNKQNQPPKNQPQQQPQGGMSKENAEQILQTMQNEEKNTQDKVNKARMQQMKGGRRTGKQW